MSTNPKAIPFTEQRKRLSWLQLRWVPVVAVLAALVVAALFYMSIAHHQNQQVVAVVSRDAQNQVAQLQQDIAQRVVAMSNLGDRWQSQGGLLEDDFVSDAEALHDDYPGFLSLQWVDPSLSVRWISPREGNEIVKGIKSAFEPKRMAALQRSRVNNSAAMTEVVELLQGGSGLLIYMPLYSYVEFDGYLVATMRVDDWMGAVFSNPASEEAYASLVTMNEVPIRQLSSEQEVASAKYRGVANANIMQHRFTVQLQATNSMVAAYWPLPASSALLLLLLVGLLMAAIVYIWVFASRIGKEALVTERRLQEEMHQSEQAQRTLHKMAYYDALTGLPSRRLAIERLRLSMALAAKRHVELGVLYIDLDGFKEVNDKHGHAVGDALLVEMSNTMRRLAREVDTVARLGGDEFLVILSDVESAKQVAEIVEEYDEALAEPLQLRVHGVSYDLKLSASVGIGMYPVHASSAEGLIRYADKSMYTVKEQSKKQSGEKIYVPTGNIVNI